MKKIIIKQDVIINENILLEEGDVIEVIDEPSKEISEEDFIEQYSDEIKVTIQQTKQYAIQKDMTPQWLLDQVLNNLSITYDEEIVNYIRLTIVQGVNPIAVDVAKVALEVFKMYGTDFNKIFEAFNYFVDQINPEIDITY